MTIREKRRDELATSVIIVCQNSNSGGDLGTQTSLAGPYAFLNSTIVKQ